MSIIPGQMEEDWPLHVDDQNPEEKENHPKWRNFTSRLTSWPYCGAAVDQQELMGISLFCLGTSAVKVVFKKCSGRW